MAGFARLALDAGALRGVDFVAIGPVSHIYFDGLAIIDVTGRLNVVPADIHRALGLTDDEAAIDCAAPRPGAQSSRARYVRSDVERALLVQVESCASKAATDRWAARIGRTGGERGCDRRRRRPGRSAANRKSQSPSAIEPYQGAATGVGGILRDIFTMGARPIALMDPLRFGPRRILGSRWIAAGVISGISGYGNSVGVPTVGGEIAFDDCYVDNPLVNVLCCGVLPVDRLVLGRASGEGNLAVLLGNLTGRDGIGGVSVLHCPLLRAPSRLTLGRYY